jgi:hypothetical protein
VVAGSALVFVLVSVASIAIFHAREVPCSDRSGCSASDGNSGTGRPVAGRRSSTSHRPGRGCPGAEVPSKLNLTTQPTVSPDGRKLTTTSDGMTGKVKVVLADDTGSRTLLSAHGPGEYGLPLGYGAPNWEWVAADDGRILVITTDDPSTTRVLLADRGGRSGGAEGATFAVTAENILTP